MRRIIYVGDVFSDEKFARLSDDGVGVERIISFDDPPEPTYDQHVKAAMNRLRAHPELQRTLRLIIKNRDNRKESIWEMMSKKPGNGRRREEDIMLTLKKC